VFFFMCGHSLHAQFASGGAGMNVLSGDALIIEWRMPGSVATMNSRLSLLVAKLRMPVVDPT
jgi:hypothetical protein